MRASRSGKVVALWGLALICLFYLLAPPGWMLISSFSPATELHSRPPHWLPHQPTIEHYETLFQTQGANARALQQNPQVRAFPRSFLNSFIIATATTLICVVFGAISAYSLSRFVKRDRQRWILLGAARDPHDSGRVRAYPDLLRAAAPRHAQHAVGVDHRLFRTVCCRS